MTAPIYLDHNATTPIAPEVRDAMVRALDESWGNPSSSHHHGLAARETIRRARADVAGLLGADPEAIVFTSGGTESDNAAIIGVAEALADRGRHIVTTTIEHPAVDRACAYLESRGWRVKRVGPDSSGVVDPSCVAEAIRNETVLVTVMHANNETGVIQPVAEIARLARRRGCLVHTDAAQSVGKIPVDVRELGVDLLTVAGHKLYGPKGVGALFVREGVPLVPLMKGGDHERGRRAGTENIPGIAGLSAACVLARSELAGREGHMRAMRDRLEERIRALRPDVVVHGARAPRLPNTSSLAFPGSPARVLVERLPELAVSTGAACHADRDAPSTVLLAMGISPEIAVCTLRVSTGRSTTPDEIDDAAERIAAVAGRGAC